MILCLHSQCGAIIEVISKGSGSPNLASQGAKDPKQSGEHLGESRREAVERFLTQKLHVALRLFL